MAKKKEFPCENCKMRAKYEANPKSFAGRLWHWHTKFCPGWKSYMDSFTEEKRQEYIIRYNLKSK